MRGGPAGIPARTHVRARPHAAPIPGLLRTARRHSTPAPICTPATRPPHTRLTTAPSCGTPPQLVRRWNPALLEPAADPLYCHNNSVRALAAGPRQVVVSGDKGGEVAVWKVV